MRLLVYFEQLCYNARCKQHKILQRTLSEDGEMPRGAPYNDMTNQTYTCINQRFPTSGRDPNEGRRGSDCRVARGFYRGIDNYEE